jgi:hypothetical protein
MRPKVLLVTGGLRVLEPGQSARVTFALRVEYA